MTTQPDTGTKDGNKDHPKSDPEIMEMERKNKEKQDEMSDSE